MLGGRRGKSDVYFSDESVVRAGPELIAQLKERALQSPRGSCRLCAHRTEDDRVHEMLIVHARRMYVRPMKHVGRSMSYHVIEGTADLILFDDDGGLTNVIPIGDATSGRIFYCRLSEPVFCAQLIRSDFLVFHESTSGPFKPDNTEWAPWAPEPSDADAVKSYLDRLDRAAAGWGGAR